MRYAIAFFEEQKLNGSAPGSQSGSVRWLVVQFGEFEDHQRPRVEQKSKSRKANRTQLVQTPHPTRTHHPLHRCTNAPPSQEHEAQHQRSQRVKRGAGERKRRTTKIPGRTVGSCACVCEEGGDVHFGGDHRSRLAAGRTAGVSVPRV